MSGARYISGNVYVHSDVLAVIAVLVFLGNCNANTQAAEVRDAIDRNTAQIKSAKECSK